MQTKRKEHESKWFLNVMGHVMFTSILLVSTSGRGLEELPKPKKVYVNSINMRHILRWSSVRVPLGEVSYSVQFQGNNDVGSPVAGYTEWKPSQHLHYPQRIWELCDLNSYPPDCVEFERNHRKTWVAITECSSIRETWCDVTADVSSDVDYDLKVRTELGNVTSKWKNLSKLFNRKETNLTAPTLTAGVSGGLVSLNVSEIKKNVNAHIYYWKEGVEQQVMNVSIAENQNPYYLNVEKGVVYCFQAQLYILEYNKFSSFSDIVCETVSDDTMSKGHSVTIATALLLGVGFLAVSLFCIGRFCCRTRPVWFPKISAPSVSNFEDLRGDVLKEEDSSQNICDTVEVWHQSEALLAVHETLTARERINNREDKEGWPMNSVSYGEVCQPQRSMQITYQKGYQSQMNLVHTD